MNSFKKLVLALLLITMQNQATYAMMWDKVPAQDNAPEAQAPEGHDDDGLYDDEADKEGAASGDEQADGQQQMAGAEEAPVDPEEEENAGQQGNGAQEAAAEQAGDMHDEEDNAKRKHSEDGKQEDDEQPAAKRLKPGNEEIKDEDVKQDRIVEANPVEPIIEPMNEELAKSFAVVLHHVLQAALKGNSHCLVSLLAADDNHSHFINTLIDGFTAFAKAVKAGKLPVAQLLLEKGANPQIYAGNEGQSLLHEAAQAGNAQLMELLLNNNGANPSAVDNQGQTALHYAVKANNSDAIQLLTNRGDVNQFIDKQDNNNKTASCYAVEIGDFVIVITLVSRGANPQLYQGAQGQSLLHEAAQRGDINLATKLLSHGANPRAVDANNQTSLHYAINAQQTAAALLLLQDEKVADFIDLQDTQGNTALHYATTIGDFNVVVSLTKNGANLTLRNAENKNAVILALEQVNMLGQRAINVIMLILNAFETKNFESGNNNDDVSMLTKAENAQYGWIHTKQKEIRQNLHAAAEAARQEEEEAVRQAQEAAHQAQAQAHAEEEEDDAEADDDQDNAPAAPQGRKNLLQRMPSTADLKNKAKENCFIM